MCEPIDTENTILFVGAGVSQNLGLPSWSELMDKVAEHLEYDPLILKQFGGYLSLAEFYQIKRGSVGPLRSWMDVNWNAKDIEVTSSEVHEAIVKAGFRKIYTTNFDRWLERACDHWNVRYRKILTVKDLTAGSSLTFEDAGEHELKGVPDRWRLYRVVS